MRKIAALFAVLLGVVLFAQAASALPASQPRYDNGSLGGVPMIAFPGQHLSVTASGFAATSPVQVGIYDHNGQNLDLLGVATTDTSGHLAFTTAPLPSATVYRGKQSSVCADGTDPYGHYRLLCTSVTVF